MRRALTIGLAALFAAAPAAEAAELVTVRGGQARLDAVRAAGATPIRPLPGGRHLVRAAAPLPRALQPRPVTVQDKLVNGVPARGRVAVTLQTLAGAAGARARARAGVTGPPSLVGVSGSVRSDVVTLPAPALRQLAADPAVILAEPAWPLRTHDERQALMVSGRFDGPGTGPGLPGYDAAALTGYVPTGDVIVSVVDGGLDNGTTTPAHPDFAPGTIAFNRNRTTAGSNADCTGHGTLDASVIAGLGTNAAGGLDAAGYRFGEGIAPGVRIGVEKVFDCPRTMQLAPGVTLGAITADDHAAEARITNNSWGADVAGAYTANSALYDALVRDADPQAPGNQAMIEVFSAGNAGAQARTIGSPATGKNVISVGASVSPLSTGQQCYTGGGLHDIASFSSRGPTADGRQKPDLVAPGTNIAGARPSGGGSSGTCGPLNTLYNISNGTSHSAPAVAGAAALLYAAVRQRTGAAPSPALVKAVLTNSARDLGRPRGDQGAGLLAVDRALHLDRQLLRDQRAPLSVVGAQARARFTVHDPTAPTPVTLAWTDAPAAPGAAKTLINDLDVSVTVDGETYAGAPVGPGTTASGGAPDRLNNLERVVLPAGVQGPVTVTVTAHALPGDGVPGVGDETDQDFALTAANVATAEDAPELEQTGWSISDADGDGVVETGERAVVHTAMRNQGDSPATGAFALTGTGGLTPDVPSLTVTGLAPGASQTADIGVSVAASAPCGTEVTLAGAATDGPLAPNGISARALLGDRPGTEAVAPEPLAIPDSSPAGVTLPITVSTPGLVDRLEVQLGRIDHTAVGDLVVDLTSPAGTTVRLVDRIGPPGARNQGDDLRDVVLADDAAAPLFDAAAGQAPFTGRWRPARPLSAFAGEPAAGTWVLRVADAAPADTGALVSAALDPFVCNLAPTAALDVPAATAGAPVTVDASGSRDPEGAALTYRFDTDGDGVYERDAGGAAQTAVTFGAAGARSVGVQVRDPDGETATARAVVQVGAAAVPPLPPAEPDGPAAELPRFTWRTTKLDRRTGGAALRLALPAPGRVAVRVTGPRRLKVASARARARRPGAVTVRFTPSRRARAALRRKGRLKVTVRIVYTPQGAAAQRRTEKLTLRLRR